MTDKQPKTKEFIDALMARPLHMHSDLADYLAVAEQWGACTDMMAVLSEAGTLANLDEPEIIPECIEWFYTYYTLDSKKPPKRWQAGEMYMADECSILLSYAVDLPTTYPEIEELLLQNYDEPGRLAEYAWTFYEGDGWPAAHDHILGNIPAMTFYVREVLKRRWDEAEEYVIDTAMNYYNGELGEFILWYVRDMIGGRWYAMEQVLQRPEHLDLWNSYRVQLAYVGVPLDQIPVDDSQASA